MKPARPGQGNLWLMQVAATLASRGVRACARDLADRSLAEQMRAHAWAELGEPARDMPGWLARFAPPPSPRVGEQLCLERTRP